MTVTFLTLTMGAFVSEWEKCVEMFDAGRQRGGHVPEGEVLMEQLEAARNSARPEVSTVLSLILIPIPGDTCIICKSRFFPLS